MASAAAHGGRALVLVVALVTVSWAGCIGGDVVDEELGVASIPPAGDLASKVLVTHTDDGGWHMQVPVQVFVIGFDPIVAQALAGLGDEQVFHAHSSFTMTVPPDPSQPQAPLLQGEIFDHPHVPSADFVVLDPGPSFADAFWSFVAANPVDTEEPDVYDANAAEAYLYDGLRAAGYHIGDAVPSLVVLHANGSLPEGHAWRYTLPEGYLEPVRHFGERTPLVVHDLSARPDPYVVNEGPSLSPLGLVFGTLFGPTPTHDYDLPQGAGLDVVPVVDAYLRDAAHHRILQGAIYPISTKPCHHVTLLMAVDQTALTEVLPGFTRAEDWVSTERLQDAFTNLTRDEVKVDLTWRMLPQEEPVLAALVRGAAGFATLDALRLYLDQNWESFVEPAEGCEEYLSIMYFADAAAHAARIFGGIGMYDVDQDRRISFSIVTDVSRFQDEYAGPAEDVLAPKDPSEDPVTYVNLLFSHETGHLLGQHHPQHLIKARDPSPANDAFQAAYTVMSYQTGTRIIDFGAVDTANWLRNRAGFSMLKAHVLDLEGTPAYEDATRALMGHDWAATHLLLEDAIQAADREHAPGTSPTAFHAWTAHEHPW